MRLFYEYGKSQPIADQLSWSHYIELLPYSNINKINYYIKITEEQNLSVRELKPRIKNNKNELI